MSAIRNQLKSDLETALPKFRITRGIASPQRIAKPTIVLEQKSIDPSTDAGGWIDLGVSVHVITHHEGITDTAEDAIDALVFQVLHALEHIRNLKIGTATKKVFSDTNLSYEIETTITARKKVTQ